MASEMNPQSEIMKIVLGSYLAQALRAVAKHGIADHFDGGRKTTAELAASAKVHEGALRRTLRALAGSGVFESFPGDKWGLTAVGDVLRSDSPISLRNAPICANDALHWGAWGSFPEALASGKPQVEKVFGYGIWEYYNRHPDDAGTFSGYMSNISSISLGPVLDSYDFSWASVIADIGGAHGALLAGVLRKNEAASGILFDRAEVLQGALPVLGDVADRVKCVEGDFMKDEMPKADVYLLKHILHDWDDEKCVTILRGLSAVMSRKSRILVIEMTIPEPNEPGQALLQDLNMLVLLDGMERTAVEFEALFKRANLELVRTIKTKTHYGIVEAQLAKE